jgi:hypothetical protein
MTDQRHGRASVSEKVGAVSNVQDWSSVPRLAWVGVGILAVLVIASAILFARIILGWDDSSRVWIPVLTMVTMVGVAVPTGWSIGSALQRRTGVED